MATPSEDADDPYASLSTFDTIFLIDDSGSITSHQWQATSKALENIIPVCAAHDADGIDIYFLNHNDPGCRNVTNAGEVREIFQTVRPGGSAPTGRRLHHILQPYLRKLQADPDSTKPINIICITEGEPSDDVESPLIAAAKKLDKLDAPAWQVGVQFFQLSRHREAEEQLRRLDQGLQSMTSLSDRTYYSERTAPGQLHGSGIEALVDTGAGPNFISDRWLTKRRIQYDKTTTQKITRADSTDFSTIGTVSLPWAFQGEAEQHMVAFEVVPHFFCAAAITLGSRFMRATKTLTEFASRLSRRLRSYHGPRVFFQGGSQLRMIGYCDQKEVSAIPDTGSDVSLISTAFANRLGNRIDTSEEYLLQLKLPGRHAATTSGLVRDVEWRFEVDGPAYHIDCYVLEGLPADVLLHDAFLEETNAFQQFPDLLVDLGDYEHLFLNIQVVRRLRDRVKQRLTGRKEAVPCDTSKPMGTPEEIEQTVILDKMEAILSTNATAAEKELELAPLRARYMELIQHGPSNI